MNSIDSEVKLTGFKSRHHLSLSVTLNKVTGQFACLCISKIGEDTHKHVGLWLAHSMNSMNVSYYYLTLEREAESRLF